ncbi:MAG: ChbG/HpnK family deacetylase [Anaerolineales bacterium]|nr:ChbG/HpnK family deacetylase [Anaerolineales bacterium]
MTVLSGLVVACGARTGTPISSAQHPSTNSGQRLLGKPAFHVIAYVTEASVVEIIPFDKLTHINYAFLIPNADGTFARLANSWKLKKIVAQAHDNGVKVLISVGGWGWDKEFETLAADPQARARCVQGLVDLLAEYNLDGVDMDWEYPDPGQSSRNFLALMSELRAALQETPRLGLGVHLVLTSGKPLLPPEQARSLVDESGAFLKPDELVTRLDTLDLAEIEAEWRAQIEKFIHITGRKPTHLDSHHHSSYFRADMFGKMLELAREYDCAIRLPRADGLPPEVADSTREFTPRLLAEFIPRTPQTFIASFYDEDATQANLLKIIENLADGVSELMSHPGYADADLLDVQSGSIYARQRESELTILTAPEVRDAIQRKGIELITFRDL